MSKIYTLFPPYPFDEKDEDAMDTFFSDNGGHTVLSRKYCNGTIEFTFTADLDAAAKTALDAAVVANLIHSRWED